MMCIARDLLKQKIQIYADTRIDRYVCFFPLDIRSKYPKNSCVIFFFASLFAVL